MLNQLRLFHFCPHFSLLNRVGGHFEQYSGSIELLSLAYFIVSVVLTSDPISKVQRIQMILDQLILNYLIKINKAGLRSFGFSVL